jgi:indole-3-acetate monooxygenase
MSATDVRGTRSTARPVDVSGVIDLVRERADASERAARLDDDVVASIRATGINRLLIPAVLGGFEASLRQCVETIEPIAAADGSTGWASAIGFGSNLFAGYVERDAAAEIFADPDASNASMFAPLGNAVAGAGGQLRLTGRWPFTSNCLHASWIGVGAFFHDAADGAIDPVPRVVFVPRPAMQVHDTWDVAGMRATGSHHTSVDAVVVDRAYSHAFGEAAWADGTLWRVPIFMALVPCLTGVFLGIARGALDEIGRQAREGRSAMRTALADDPLDMADLGTADTRLRAARAGLLEVLDEAWALADEGIPIDRMLQARSILATLHVVDVSVEATSTAHRLGGGPAAFNNSRLLRALRDVQTARQHTLFAHGLTARLGPSAAGIDVVVPPFVV